MTIPFHHTPFPHRTEDILEHFDVEVLPPELQEKLGYTPNEQAK